LEVGKEAYLNQNDEARSILDSMDALTVQRNNGIDGFLKIRFFDTPIAIRIQRSDESLEEARKQLLKASITKGCILKILIRTQPDQTMFALEDLDDNLLVIDSYELAIDQWLAEKIETAKREEMSLSPNSKPIYSITPLNKALDNF
jgi:site-specific DNA-methyltransferase (adenine-specific)